MSERKLRLGTVAPAGGRPTYRGAVADAANWAGFEFRPDDIVISTPSKSGTTWMQMLVGLLIFGGPEFPAPLNVISPWLDMNTRPQGEVRAALEAQEHRRFIKTHVPLDALPWDDRVTYLVVGRDPRDVIVSMWHHMVNLSPTIRDLVVEVRGEDYLASLPHIDLPTEPGELFRSLVGLERGDNHTAVHPAWVLHHLATGWERRHLPNVALFHYADLQQDLAGEIVRLGEVLGRNLSRRRAEDLAAEASLSRMRQRASETSPAGEQDIWRDPKQFFRSGGRGEWRDLVTPDDVVRYEERVAELVDPDLAHWAHHGWRGDQG